MVWKYFLQDKSTKSRRGGLDRCSETNINNKKHNTELCYVDSFAGPRSTNSPGFHRKGLHFGHQADKGIVLDCLRVLIKISDHCDVVHQ